MIALVLTTEAERTEQKVMLLVVLLLAVALLLAAATIWYWRYTNPRRRHQAAADLDQLHRRLDPAGRGQGVPAHQIDPAPTGEYPTNRGRQGGYQADPFGTRIPPDGQYGGGQYGYGAGQQQGGGYGAGQQAGQYVGGHAQGGNGVARGGGGQYGQPAQYGGQSGQPGEQERILPRNRGQARRPPDGRDPNWR